MTTETPKAEKLICKTTGMHKMMLYRMRKKGIIRGYKIKGFKTTFYYISEINQALKDDAA